MTKVLYNPNLFSFIFIFPMFSRVTEGVSLSKIDGKSAMYRTLTDLENLTMWSHDVRNVLMMSVMRALCVLCGRYAGATRAMRVRHTGYVGGTCTLWVLCGCYGLALWKNAKKSVVRAGIMHPPMREATTFLRARSVAQRVIAPTLLSSENFLYLC
jgi:hypothetical protein